MKIKYNELIATTEDNNVYVLNKPFLSNNVENNYKLHSVVQTYDENTKDFKRANLVTLSGVNFFCKAPNDFIDNNLSFKAGDDVIVNYHNDKYTIVNLDKFDKYTDFEMIDYMDFKNEEKDIEAAKKIGVEFFTTKIEAEYSKKIKKLHEESSIKIGSIKIGK